MQILILILLIVHTIFLIYGGYKFMPIKEQVQQLIEKVQALQAALVKEAEDIKAAVQQIIDNTGAGLDISTQLAALTDAVAGIDALSNLVVLPDTTVPSQPGVPEASNVTSTSADLTWPVSTDNVAVAGYDVYQDGVVVATVPSNSASISGLNPATTYLFAVQAKDSAGNKSVLSDSVTVVTLPIV